MGLFKKIKKAVKKVAKPIVKIAPKAITAGATGGLSLIAPKSFQQTLQNTFAPTSFRSVANLALAAGTRNPAYLTGGSPMAVNLGGILGQVSTIFGGNQNPYFQTISNVAGLGSQFAPYAQPVGLKTMATPAKGGVPMIPTGRGPALTREVFDSGVKVLQRLGIPFGASPGAFSSALKRALSGVASLARRTPAGTMVNLLIGLGLAAGEAYLLTVWHSQRKKGRRMNPANSKALRRAARRIRSFHKLCTHTDLLRTRSRSAGRSRCGTCRKSPCRC